MGLEETVRLHLVTVPQAIDITATVIKGKTFSLFVIVDNNKLSVTF